MTTQQKVESLIQQVASLPEEALEQVVRSLIDMRAEDLGLYPLDEDERPTFALGANDIRRG